MTAVLELAQLYPPATRFFIGVLLVIGVVTVEALSGLLIYFFLYGREE